MAPPHSERSPANLRILNYPDPALRRRAMPVTQVTPEVREVAARMIELMREAEGIGLAAPQVGLPWRLFVAHVPPTEDRSPESDPVTATTSARVYVNPVLSAPVGVPEPFDEGCLSLPDITGEVLRPPTITISATDLDGRAFTQTAGGLLARCWQHELDHLDGVLIIDRMTQMSRLKNRSALRDLEKRKSKS
jgi:peptide deformylase